MALATTTRPAPFGAITTLKLVAGFEATVRSVLDWNTRRQTASALAQLSDRQLADIGLIRGDLDSIPAKF